MEQEIKKKPNILREYAESISIAIIIALIVRAFFIQAFRIPTGSMKSTLLVGDFLLVNKFVYGANVPYTDWRLPKLAEPQVGDVVVFKYPKDPDLDYIKRCIALEGQTVEIRDKELFIDGKKEENPEKVQFLYKVIPKGVPDPEIYPSGKAFNRDNYGPFEVPADHIFVMGDNRDNSLDSRYWGPLPVENVIGKASLVYWSWDNEEIEGMFSKIRWNRIGTKIQ